MYRGQRESQSGIRSNHGSFGHMANSTRGDFDLLTQSQIKIKHKNKTILSKVIRPDYMQLDIDLQAIDRTDLTITELETQRVATS
jgi:hypothetical protein